MIGVSDLLGLADDMNANADRMVREVLAEAGRAGKAIERQMRTEARAGAAAGFWGGEHLPSFPASITHDVKPRLRGDVVVEIGPDKDRRQGALGAIVYFGSANNAPIAVLDGPATRESERVSQRLVDIGAGVLDKSRP